MTAYERPPDRPGLRLHLNENTAGCSPQVLQRLRSLGASRTGFYPDYGPAREAAARWFGVRGDQMILTNGLDEGLFAAAILALRGRADGEAIVVDPAFEVYPAIVEALAGTVVRVRFRPGFVLEAGDVLSAVTARTRLVFLNDPHNPSGARIPYPTIRAIARGAPHAIVFLDEAYAEFAAESFIDEAVSAFANVIVGRTFAKAYGLAGLRLGAVIAAPPLIEALAGIVPPYSVNVYAAEALTAALADRAYIDAYVAEAAASRQMLRDFCASRSLDAFPSAANFVLIRVGPGAAAVAAVMAQRGVLVRDRSDQPVCDGCIRITAGWLADTRTALGALEEALCAAR
ncbi:MAG TPA: histidinol-phosphate transaminase [Vicinamibacterales bacterium]|nr:histidinol-phosphate transaminase [Vicinamibacterales bacterium]